MTLADRVVVRPAEQEEGSDFWMHLLDLNGLGDLSHRSRSSGE